MKKILLSLIFLVIATTLLAQPQYYNWNNVGTSSNTFPFGQSAGKAVNYLFLAGSFTDPTPLPAGNQITKVYFFITTGGTRTYTDFHILMAQTENTDLTTGQFYAGPWDTVFYSASSPQTWTTNSWSTPITLDTPFPYDPTKSLVVFLGQCGGAGSGMYVRNNTAPGGIKRVWSVGGCPFVPYAGGDASTLNFGVDVEPAGPVIGTVPEVLYYKFDETGTDSTENFAIPGSGTPWAPVIGLTMGGSGQFDSALVGTGGSSTSNYVNTGWATDIGTSSWTISLWLNNITTTFGYYFGDNTANSWRCFLNGAAGTNNITLRGGGMVSLIANGVVPGPSVVTFVYDSAAGQVSSYVNGVFDNAMTQTPLNITGTGPYKVGGYSSSAGLLGSMDEFRLYNRALDSTEISQTWNQTLPLVSGVITPVLNMPDQFGLSQNYPNPFNPSTKIDYQIPNSGLVILKVYDVLGKEVATLVNEVKQAGSYTVTFNASSLPSGTYFYRLEAGDYLGVKKMILLK